MSTQSLPAPSLRTGLSLPAARLVRWVVNYMIYKAVWLIMSAIFGAEPSFLPTLRETRIRYQWNRVVSKPGCSSIPRGGLHERNRSTETRAAAFQLFRFGNQ